MDGNVPITESIRLKKQINDIEVILNSSKKSDLLNKNSSSTAKDDSDKKSSCSCIVKSSAKESSSKQKDIDNLYRSIEQKVFGRDKDCRDISRKLRERLGTNAASSSTSKPYSVIGIYGITGSGKTTLAELVCKYERGKAHFNLVMFIHVGKTFSLVDIFSDMLEQIKKQACDTKDPKSRKTELTDLKEELEKELHNKCFLLVLDDLWVNGDNKKERRILLDVLNAGKSGSRILVTAQRKDAAAALGAQEQMNTPIPDLEEEQYLSMFMHYALEGSQVTSSDYERYRAIGERITKKLRSSPIAARTVAAQLQSNINIDFWETTGKLDVLNETMGALWWSYQQLDVDIRRCFTYCSIFPKGYELKRDQLVRFWIAQGFVKPRSNAIEDLEALGQNYFDHLLTFSFIQVRPKTEWFGQEIVDFIIHDLLHELARRVSGTEFWSIDLKNDSTKDSPLGARHLFIKANNLADIVEKVLDMRNLRTLIIKVEESSETINRSRDREEEILERLFMRLTKLRILILDHFGWKLSVPPYIGHMKHLRYFGSVCFRVAARLTLPSTFSKLYHIQIIDIPCNEASGPEDMANLTYLRHISAPLSFANIGRLTSLQTLNRFVRKVEQGYQLKQLMHLNLQGSLTIADIGNVRSKEEALDAHLMHKEGLTVLRLRFDGREVQSRKLEVNPDVEAEVLEGLCPPKYIQELHIGDYRGSRYPSWMLSRHHPDAPKKLHRLEIYFCSQLASIPEGSVFLTGLRELCILGCDWDRLPENMEHLLSLQKLEILSCKRMELLPTLPQGLKKIQIRGCEMLRSIDIMDCTRLMTRDPCLVDLEIRYCANLVALLNLPPSLKNLSIDECGALCSVSGQLRQLEHLYIQKCNKLQSVGSLLAMSSIGQFDWLSVNRVPGLSTSSTIICRQANSS